MDGDAEHIKSILAQGEDENTIFRKPASSTVKLKDDAVVLTEIESALSRLDRGSFGYCIDCGARIDILRLAHDPTVSRCIVCESGKKPTKSS
ncbi:MAG: TraR/DksA C4-type zinc finger protein [Pseudomonadota bacterium]